MHPRWQLQVAMAGDQSSRHAVLAVMLSILVGGAAGVDGAAMLDNVAVQWNYLFCVIHCKSTGALQEPNIIFAQLHLAQWHALLALRHITGSSTTEELVVAFASHTILANYYPYEQPTSIDPLLDTQLTALNATISQQTLGKHLGEAVALSVIHKRRPAREFALHAFKSALASDANSPDIGVYRYLNNTPIGRAAATFVFYDAPIARPYVIPDPVRFVRSDLANIKPPRVPSSAWDKAYASVVDAGRAGNPRRTQEMNSTAAVIGCPKVNSATCFAEQTWSAIARVSLPPSLSLFDTVELFAKLAVTMHDAVIAFATIQYGWWFWRPQMAIRAGDGHHKPIPDWTPWIRTPPHPEYPSGTVTSHASAAAVLETFFATRKLRLSNFTVSGGGQYGAACPISGPVAAVEFGSFPDVVAFAQRARVWSGAHYEKSVKDGKIVGETVAKYVEEFWDATTPSGVLPDAAFLNVVAALPKHQGVWSPIKLAP